MEHPYGEDDWAREAMKRKSNSVIQEVANMALRVQKENVKLKQEKKQLQDTLERIKDANRYRYMING
jgi:hypothetical protein|tara:strand:+ start:184 stop:384 length:201 start_codon:yes stop_codon:yes gene_type:complete